AAQHHLEAVVVAVQVEALALVARQAMGSGKREFGLDLMHAGSPVTLRCTPGQNVPAAGVLSDSGNLSLGTASNRAARGGSVVHRAPARRSPCEPSRR